MTHSHTNNTNPPDRQERKKESEIVIEENRANSQNDYERTHESPSASALFILLFCRSGFPLFHLSELPFEEFLLFRFFRLLLSSLLFSQCALFLLLLARHLTTEIVASEFGRFALSTWNRLSSAFARAEDGRFSCAFLRLAAFSRMTQSHAAMSASERSRTLILAGEQCLDAL